MLFKKSLNQELYTTAGATLLLLVGIVIGQRAGNFFRLAAKGILPNDAISTVLVLSLIKYLPMILSLALFLAVLLTLTRWHRDSEMIVWFSSGLGIASWIRPVITFALPTILITLVLSLFIAPWATKKAENYRDNLESRDETASINPGVFKESSNAERVYFVESFDELGNAVKNIFVQSMQHQKLGIIVANKGYRETSPNGDTFLMMEQGRRYEGVPNTAEFSTTEFERYAIRVESSEIKTSLTSLQAKSSSELLQAGSVLANAELQWRFAIPISAFILCLLAIPLSFIDPRAGRSLNMMFAILIYIIYNNLLSIMQAWIGQEKISPIIGMWPVHLFFIGLTIYLFYVRLFQLPIIPNLHWLAKKRYHHQTTEVSSVK